MSKDLKQYIRTIPNFPIDGILFRDIQPLIKFHFSKMVEALAEIMSSDALSKVDYFVGVDARGFIPASGLAQRFDKGMIMVRKKGKLPPPNISKVYDLEYGSSSLEIIEGEGNVIVIDDVLATGGTLGATVSLCESAGYTVLDVAVLIDLPDLHSFKWGGRKIKSAISYNKDEK